MALAVAANGKTKTKTIDKVVLIGNGQVISTQMPTELEKPLRTLRATSLAVCLLSGFNVT
jgi:hypothetical protein